MGLFTNLILLILYRYLIVGSVAPEATPSRVSKGLARHPVSIMVLARLAVDHSCQGMGLGAALQVFGHCLYMPRMMTPVHVMKKWDLSPTLRTPFTCFFY